ncbi:hypothetical protein A3D11_02350 [Candidatus Peribacteria bacterium RIFCSPHIGHO2_02_FULL_49_16]|nr:MAG: hypothetical protein A2880_03810 [Candidatus Peribacteria bacterium RIFCSPHIGHO2_01_FULL_49_38]OGJ59965.1 MAG: hypothetical protein A3D11_02350 [Candidatus Peribacteria bacterium RIFCSPHIGHO2_02_FULL_49_16]
MQQLLLPLLAFVILMIPGILQFQIANQLLFAFWLPLAILGSAIGFLIGKIENKTKRSKYSYAFFGFLSGAVPHLFAFVYVWVAIGLDISIVYKGTIYSILSALLFYFIAHISSLILRLLTAFLAAAIIIIGYAWWIL